MIVICNEQDAGAAPGTVHHIALLVENVLTGGKYIPHGCIFS